MLLKKYRVLLLLLIGVSTNYSCLAQKSDFDVVTRRIMADLQNNKSQKYLNGEVDKYMNALRPIGTWADINYTDNAAAIWSPADHLNRVEDFVLAYGNKNSVYLHNDALYAVIIKALRGWNRADPHCRNWWFNEISCPQSLGRIILLMQSVNPIPATLRDSLLKKMDRGDMYKQTGANKFDVALHNIYSALLTHNISLMDLAVSQSFEPVVLTTDPEGLQFDYSYLQHGPQLQVASYGSVFLTGEYKLASYLVGTHWQMPEAKEKVLAGFLDHTFINAIRYHYFDFSVTGRGFSRKGSGNAGAITGLKSDIGRLTTVDPGMAKYFINYNDAAKRASGSEPASYHVKPQHIQYWIGDYTQHVSPDYLFTVRTNSSRTRRTETGNGENLFGRYMSDGATNIQRSGSEYYNIFPVWEYDKIPGVTCRSYARDRLAVNTWSQPGASNFTGGVTDGLYGANTYTLDFDSVKAQKAWFFFDHQIICLGTGIRSTAPNSITTSINQCWSRGEVMVNFTKQAYWQDSIGYYIKPGGTIHYTAENQKGKWSRINISQPEDTVSGKVFKLWIDHGANPQNAGYAYAVVPGISAKQFKQVSPFSDVEILSNTNSIQAVANTKLNIVQIVFYKAGKITAGNIIISASEACVLMLKKKDAAGIELFVADPTLKLTNITVTVNGKKAECTLPEKQYAGSTTSIYIKL